MNPRARSITLIELLIAIVLLSIIVLGLGNIDLFSRSHLLSSDRRAKIDNELSLALAHMGKNVVQGVGIQGVGIYNLPPLEQTASGFRVRVDSLKTPLNLNDDRWFNYALSTNTLSATCTQVSVASPACTSDETLSTHIISGVVFDSMPSSPTSGFYIKLTNGSTVAEIGLVARYQPANAVGAVNPQIEMKSKLYTLSSAAR